MTEKLIFEGSIPPQEGCGFELNENQILKVIDPQGEQVSDLFCFAKNTPSDTLSSGRSIDYNETIFFSKGHNLYSRSGHIMMEIIQDTCGRHDFLVTPCSCQMFQMIEKNNLHHPSCLENLEKSFLKFNLDTNLIGTTFNIFMNVEVAFDGKIKVAAPLSKRDDFVSFKAKMDLYVGLTACSDEGTNAGRCKPIKFMIFDP